MPDWLVWYLLIGAVVTALTFVYFRPVQGYRPSWGLVGLGIVAFTLLWPILVLLAILMVIVLLIQVRRHAASRQKQQVVTRSPMKIRPR